MGVLVAAVGTALTPFASTDVPLAILVVIVGAGGGVMIPANLTLVARGAPEGEKGLANGIYGTALGLGGAITNWVWGPVGETAGIAWTFWGSTLVAVVGAVGVIVYAVRHGDGDGIRAVPDEQDLEPSPVGE